MTIDEMKRRKTELGLTSEMIAEQSGVPLGTVQKIFGGATKAPRKRTIDALERVLGIPSPASILSGCGVPADTGSPSASGLHTASGSNAYDFQDSHTLRDGCELREASFQYETSPRKKFYTLDDYYALPDERRVELIDGVFYDMVAPSAFHQLILGHLSYQFRECAREHDKACEVLMAPFDVRLDMDNYTMVQPDLLVICHELDYLHLKRLEGAPDLAVEILSPSSRSKDMFLKLYKYQNAGVREYWIVDPENQTVTVHLLEDDEHYEPKKYSFQDCIPVGISDGTCSISLSELMERLSGYRS